MPSRPLFPPPTSPHVVTTSGYHLLLTLTIIVSTVVILTVFLLYLYYTFKTHCGLKTIPFSTSPSILTNVSTKFPPLRRFSHQHLRRATNNFHPSTSLGRGASATVFLATTNKKPIAIKLLHDCEGQNFNSEETFLNELRLFSSVIAPSPFVVTLIGYSVGNSNVKMEKKKKKKKEMVLVYEYLKNGSLQEVLFRSAPQSESESPVVLEWERRFGIICDVARGLKFLHLDCDPPVIHGDIKPSNVLLDVDFNAKISDFGLSRVKNNDELVNVVCSTSPTVQPPVKFTMGFRGSSPSSLKKNACLKEKEMMVTFSCEDDLFSIDHSKELSGNITAPVYSPASGELLPASDEWWWRQNGSGELSSRDYVSEWIGSQICSISDPDWQEDTADKISPVKCKNATTQKREHRELPVSSVDDIIVGDTKHKKMEDWWKEEYFEDIKKRKKNIQKTKHKYVKIFRFKKRTQDAVDGEEKPSRWLLKKRRKKKKKMEVRDSSTGGSDIFSKELGSATSMRGTICYMAPELGSAVNHLMEKTDIYSLGVLILVIVSGRRPLHVLSSPMKLERANLISWCKQLAQSGDVLSLVDERLGGEFNKKEATLCINLALMCLHRLPELRPEIGEILGILNGEVDLPVVPLEFSPSPPSKRSRRKPKSLQIGSI